MDFISEIVQREKLQRIFFFEMFFGRRPRQLFRTRFWRGAGLELPEGRGMGDEEEGGGGDSV